MPVAYAFDALTFPHMLVVAFLMGRSRRPLPGLVPVAVYAALVPRGASSRAARSSTEAAPCRTSPGRASAACSCRRSRAGDPGPRRVLVRRLGPVPAARQGGRAGAEPLGRGHVVAPASAGFSATDHPGRARRHGDDQLLQLRLRRALHPLRDEVARHRGRARWGSCSAPAPSGAYRRNRHQPHRRRIGVGPAFAVGCVVFPAPLLLVPLAEGPRVGDPRVPLPRRVRLRDRRDDARHHRERDRRCGDSGPAALPGRGRVHGRQLRRPAAGSARRRRAGTWIGLRPTLGSRPPARSPGPLAASVADPRLGLPEAPDAEGALAEAPRSIASRPRSSCRATPWRRPRVLGRLPGVVRLVLGVVRLVLGLAPGVLGLALLLQLLVVGQLAGAFLHFPSIRSSSTSPFLGWQRVVPWRGRSESSASAVT